ncbi:MAG: hypothetical protein QNJ44_00030 [Rhodobacter sp.]|nr:hypothetical protein [Rhodobacter sp.]
MTESVYVSITGLRVRRFWHLPTFWRHAVALMAQAQRADGCLGASAKTIHGVHHTRSVWRDRDDMLAFLGKGEHLDAMKVFHRIATGKTLGFEATSIPDWDEVHRLWTTDGNEVNPEFQ